MRTGELGITYDAGEYVFRRGEVGSRMFLILTGEVEVLVREHGRLASIATYGPGEFVGEEAMVEKGTHSSDGRVVTKARLLAVDRRHFLRRLNEDPTLTLSILRQLSQRVRTLGRELARLRAGGLQ